MTSAAGETVIPFLKMHGAANDFVVVDHRRAFLPSAGIELADLVRRLCDRRRGVGADGVLLLENAAEADASMRYLNADGGEAEYCGNGVRCLARFALELGLGHGGVVRLATAVGVQETRRSAAGIVIRFGHVEAPGPAFAIEALGHGFSGRQVQVGVPHFVVPYDPLSRVQVQEWGGALRRHPHFGRDGANVDFVARRADSNVSMRTYERGVEGETLACGSGAIATAVWAATEGARSPVRVRTAGGDILIVGFEAREAGYEVTLDGPAEAVFRGEWRDGGDSFPPAPGGA